MSTKSWRSKNPEKMKEYRRKWYYKNKSHALNHQKRMTSIRRAKNSILFDSHVKPCVICSEPEPACIDFHHLDPALKVGSVSSMANQGYSEQAILTEISKCVCLCSNCHRKLHAGKVALPAGIEPALHGFGDQKATVA